MRASFVPNNVNMRNFTAPYTFVEYPKHVQLADGSFLVVNNADEEAAATATDEPDERAELMAQAKALGLNPHHKAGVEKLREMIAGHAHV
jgi:hypothetical protein